MLFHKALLVVDVQNDFCPHGALAVLDGDKIIPALNKYIKIFSKKELPIFATRDWHPKKTKHFKAFGGIWPKHCIKNTKGAQFHPKLKLPKSTIMLYKGMDPKKDCYSSFDAEDENGNRLAKLLKKFTVGEIYIGGLATDYCVKFTTLQAIKKGFKVKVLIDGIKGVNLKPDDSEKAIRQMIAKGAKIITLPLLRSGSVKG
jgi:nicotinamidase/pyrazinamidase